MNAGGFALVQCAVTTGDLPLELSWQYPGDHEVTQRPKVTITRMGDRAAMLVIDVLTADHAGNYTCVAANSAARSSFTAELHINGSVIINFVFLHCCFDPYLLFCQDLFHFLLIFLFSNAPCLSSWDSNLPLNLRELRVYFSILFFLV